MQSEIQDSPSTPSVTASSINNSVLEVDSNVDDIHDADSGITDLNQSTSVSVRSTLYEYVEEHGRTFHKYKQGKYSLPNDAVEQDRLDMQHHLCLILLEGRLQLAPIGKSPQTVLDVGTGTGIWAIEFGKQFFEFRETHTDYFQAIKYPSAKVIGTDLSPIQPAFVPPNVQFEVDDAEDDWIFSTKFDLVYMRGMMTCFSNPKSVFAKAYKAVAPGGYLELQDGVFPFRCRDDTFKDTALHVWVNACVEAAEKMGRPWTNTPHYKCWMEEVGFENVTEKVFEIPINTWPKGRKAKELGIWFQTDLLEVLVATKALLTRGLGWEVDEVEKLIVDAKANLMDKGVHAYMQIHNIWGRKPLVSATT